MTAYREKEVNILIIGNGMDISLGYPTKYADFLHFCDEFDKSFIHTIDEMSPSSIVYEYKHFTINKNGAKGKVAKVFDKIVSNIEAVFAAFCKPVFNFPIIFFN